MTDRVTKLTHRLAPIDDLINVQLRAYLEHRQRCPQHYIEQTNQQRAPAIRWLVSRLGLEPTKR